MKFNIDRQTVEELNLLGKFRTNSVYYLFNRMKTNGGGQLMDRMFHNPLLDQDEINTRSSIIQFFKESKISFLIDVGAVDMARAYLDVDTQSKKMMVFSALLVKKKLANWTRDERYKKSIEGLHAIIKILSQCTRLVAQLSNAPISFQTRVNEIQLVLNHPDIQQLLAIDIYQDIATFKMAHYEHMIKRVWHDEMEDILRFIYELDVYIAVGKVAEQKGYHFAHAVKPEENVLQVANLRHICLENGIGNDLTLNTATNVLFLTGANMAGKSTWMKSLGIGLYLAHMGFPVAADSFRFSVRAGLYTSINVADNITQGYSHFYAEVLRVKRAAELTASGLQMMLIFDELFKGTNVKDAFDGTLAVTKAFAAYKSCIFVVSTHIIEVGEALASETNIQFRYMPTTIKNGRPVYSYRLLSGVTEDRQGMMILKNEGILEMING